MAQTVPLKITRLSWRQRYACKDKKIKNTCKEKKEPMLPQTGAANQSNVCLTAFTCATVKVMSSRTTVCQHGTLSPGPQSAACTTTYNSTTHCVDKASQSARHWKPSRQSGGSQEPLMRCISMARTTCVIYCTVIYFSVVYRNTDVQMLQNQQYRK